MKAVLLDTLVRAREHRENQAFRAVAEARAILASRLTELRSIHAQRGAVRREKLRLAAQLPAEGRSLDMAALARIDSRRALLRDKEGLLSTELERARKNAKQARQTVAERVRAYLQTRSRKDGAAELRDRCRLRESQLLERRDENASEDHTLSRYIATERA